MLLQQGAVTFEPTRWRPAGRRNMTVIRQPERVKAAGFDLTGQRNDADRLVGGESKNTELHALHDTSPLRTAGQGQPRLRG